MKVFGIGLSKTGTSSLAGALEILGYRTKDYPGVKTYVAGDLSTLDPGVLDAYDALTDTPIPSLYKALDAKYPGAKFILTIRDMDGWLKSCKKQFTEKHAANLNAAHHQLFMDLYGCTVFDEALFRSGYERFTQDVLDYFRDRPGDLLTLNVTDGEGWDKLCPFLDRAKPEIPFPKANVTQIRWMKIEDVIAIAREAGTLINSYSVDARQREPSGPLPGLALRLGASLSQLWGTVQGGEAGSRQALQRVVEKLINRRLSALNAQIPIVSPGGPAMSYAERSQLNHFWLVDPMQRSAADASGHNACSVSIALIEDRKPIYGVVYVPASDTVYFAALGKGAYRANGAEAPCRLAMREGDCAALQESDLDPTPLDTPIGPALRICQLADGSAPRRPSLRATREWETAAADAILRAVGRGLRNCQSDEGALYNTVDMSHDCLRIG